MTVTAGRPRIGFVLEQALGHVAYGRSLRAALTERDDFEAVWLEVPYAGGAADRLPVLRNNWTLRGSLRARRMIERAHREVPLDGLFINTQTISFLAGGIMRRIPTLLSLDATPRNLDTLAGTYAHAVGSPRVERIKQRLQAGVYRNARAFTTWSAWAKQSLVDDYGVDASRVTVIHPGVDVAKFTRRPGPRLEGPLRILFVGGDLKRKGGDLLIDVVRRHFAETCELHLVTSAELPAMEGVFVHRGLGPQSPELLQLYADADIFALPTTGDCLAVVLGEAMAASLPIITTRVGAHEEAVADGETGYLIEPGDGEALRERIARLTSSAELREHMAARGRAVAEQRFNIGTGADAIADILMQLGSRTMPNVVPAAADAAAETV